MLHTRNIFLPFPGLLFRSHSMRAEYRSNQKLEDLETNRFDTLVEKVRAFHGRPAPGVLLGHFMIKTAFAHCPEGEYIGAWPFIQNWYFHRLPEIDKETDSLLNEIRQAGTKIVAIERIRVKPEILNLNHRKNIAICSGNSPYVMTRKIKSTVHAGRPTKIKSKTNYYGVSI